MKFNITKSCDEKKQVFGWASIAKDADGNAVVDFQDDVIEPEELEQAVYKFVNFYGDMGENHDPVKKFKGKIIESVVFTKDKQSALGIADGVVPEGWWVGFQVNDDTAWAEVKKGNYLMFSIEGGAVREPLKKSGGENMSKSRTFAEIYKMDCISLDELVADMYRIKKSESEAAEEYSYFAARVNSLIKWRGDSMDDIVPTLLKIVSWAHGTRNDERQHADEAEELISELIGGVGNAD